MTLTLVRLPGSHYCERVEALLQLKSVPYERRTLTYFDAMRVLPALAGTDTVPVLMAPDENVLWRDCPSWLEAAYPDPPLIPADATLARAVEDWEEEADLVLGHATRRLGYWALRDDTALLNRFFRARTPIATLRAAATLRVLMQRYGATAWHRDQDEAYVTAFMDRVAARLAAGDGKHLVGNTLTRADVAVATLAFVIAGLPVADRCGDAAAWQWVRATRAAVKPKRPA